MPRGDGTGPAGKGGGGKMGGPLAAGLSGYCVCQVCGHREPHIAGNPCSEKRCPKCGTRLARED